MKPYNKAFALALAASASALMISSGQAQYATTQLSNFNNFNLSALYANWSASGSQAINGGSGFTPVVTSGATSYEIVAEDYGSGAYNLPTAVNAPGATMVSLTFTLNSTTTSSTDYVGPNFDLSDGTHQVQYLDYNHYTGPGTYTVTAPIGSIDPTDITAFNLEFSTGSYGTTTPYDISYDGISVLTPVPEPTTMAFLAFGAAGLVAARRRSKAS